MKEALAIFELTLNQEFQIFFVHANLAQPSYLEGSTDNVIFQG
jgi:hypothetical protein